MYTKTQLKIQYIYLLWNIKTIIQFELKIKKKQEIILI